MSQTVIAWGDARAQKKWGTGLAVEVNRKSYFTRKFVGKGEDNIIEEKKELESDAGDRVSFDLSVQLRQKPTRGDARVKGKEESLRFHTDEVAIDQMRHPVSAGGRMTRKRTAHDLRKVARDRLADYWKQYMDELMFIYLSGARGMNQDFIEDSAFTGHAGNAIQAPDAQHIMFAGAATQTTDLTTADVFDRDFVERASLRAKMMRSMDPDAANMVPVSIEGEEHFVIVMTPAQEFSLRTSTGAGGWAELQKAAAQAEGSKNRLFRGSLGMLNNVVLHCHESVIRFDNYGVGTNLTAARALFMGRQAGVVAYGTPGGMRFMWEEEMDDYGNEPTVVAGLIMGVKKTRFNQRDFGCMAMDSYIKPTI